MKAKSAKQSRKAKSNIQLKDIKPKNDAKGGRSLHTGGVNVLMGDGSVRFISSTIGE